MYYIQPARLKELIKNAQAEDMSDELIEVSYKIAEGLHAKYSYTIDLDDFRQNSAILIFSKIDKIDVTKNVFSYMTTCVRNLARQMVRKDSSFDNHIARYIERNKGRIGEVDRRH